MIRAKKLIAICSLAAVLACSSPAGADPNDANSPLTFEMGPTKLPVSPSLIMRVHRLSPSWKGSLSYVVGIPYKGDVPIPQAGSRTMERFKPFALRQDISQEQGLLLRAMDIRVGGYNDENSYTPPEDPNSRQILLYAVSLEDAKKMALAFVQYAQDNFDRDAADLQSYIRETAEKVTRMQQRLSELTQSEETTRGALEQATKQVPYRSVQQALDAAAELDRLLNATQVEIAGIQARLQAIEAIPPNQPTAVASHLQVMRIEESVSLQGAQARKRMATELRKQADAYMDLTEALSRIISEKTSLPKDLPRESKNLEKAREDYSLLLQNEPKVVDNKVFIYPIGQ